MEKHIEDILYNGKEICLYVKDKELYIDIRDPETGEVFEGHIVELGKEI
jgi:hypothetical protein